MNDSIFLVSGASGKLGLAFIEKFKEKGLKIIGISRSGVLIDGVEICKADLLDEEEINKVIKAIDFRPYHGVYLIHVVGKFKFEKNKQNIIDTNQDNMDDEVYATNVLTLKNIINALLAQGLSKKIKICPFASVADKYDVPFWQSYTKSKNIMRSYLKELCKNGYIQALVVNVSTVDTGNENNLRPRADKTYWLDPREIVIAVFPKLFKLFGYDEVDIIKEQSGFSEGYYLDHEAILKKWENEMEEPI